jgi:hypothetical protein
MVIIATVMLSIDNWDALQSSPRTIFLSEGTSTTIQIMGREREYVAEGLLTFTPLPHLTLWFCFGYAANWYAHFVRQGGEVIWGNSTFAPDDLPGYRYSHGQLLAFRDERHPEERNLTAEDAEAWILEHTPISFQVRTPTGLLSFIVKKELENALYKLFTWLRTRWGTIG